MLTEFPKSGNFLQSGMHSPSCDTRFTAQKMKFSIKDFFSKCDQIRSLLIWSHLLKKSLIENFVFCAVIMKASNCHYQR